jgi:hypothetical protein
LLRRKRKRRMEGIESIRFFFVFSIFADPDLPPSFFFLFNHPSATLLTCFSRCTSPFKPCCREEHGTFWACYRESRGATRSQDERGKISVLPFPSKGVKPDSSSPSS